MNHQILLVSADARLAERVRGALPAVIATELHAGPRYRACPDPRGWLLILLDAQALPESDPDADRPGDKLQETAPMLWLQDPSWSNEAGWRRSGVQGRIVDYLNRGEAPSKLAFILHQHLTAAYLRRMRLPPRSASATAEGRDLQRQLNNALTGILGNAELALDASRRLPAPLQQRLERISELALQMRDAMGMWTELAAHPVPTLPAPPIESRVESQIEAA